MRRTFLTSAMVTCLLHAGPVLAVEPNKENTVDTKAKSAQIGAEAKAKSKASAKTANAGNKDPKASGKKYGHKRTAKTNNAKPTKHSARTDHDRKAKAKGKGLKHGELTATDKRKRSDERKTIKQEYKDDIELGADQVKGKKPWWKFWASAEQ